MLDTTTENKVATSKSLKSFSDSFTTTESGVNASTLDITTENKVAISKSLESCDALNKQEGDFFTFCYLIILSNADLLLAIVNQ